MNRVAENYEIIPTGSYICGWSARGQEKEQGKNV